MGIKGKSKQIKGATHELFAESNKYSSVAPYPFSRLSVIAFLKGVRYRAVGAAVLLRNNVLIFGVGGVIAPFISIKLIDMLIAGVGLA